MTNIIAFGLFLMTTNFFSAQIHDNHEQRELFIMDQLTEAVDSFSQINQKEPHFCDSFTEEGTPCIYSNKPETSGLYFCRTHNIKSKINSSEFHLLESNKK